MNGLRDRWLTHMAVVVILALGLFVAALFLL